MCGISVVINKENKEVENSEIKTINNLISHRGPDDEGFYFGSNFAFGHRRLSILDTSKDGHQPMYYKDKYVITYNGEVYNYIEIKEELTEYGYKFETKTDTEVILAAYDKWGENCVSKFNGMWSFVIHDKENDILFCSRDRFGIKPFYYTEVNNKLVFGSEIKQMLYFHKDNFVNEKILMDYLVIGYEEHTNETFFTNVNKLPQSHNLIYNLKSHKYKIQKYYDINIDNSLKNNSEKESIENYKKSFYNSIKLRLRSDVKVGTCLSGGLDSSAVAAVAAKMYESNDKFSAVHAKSTMKISDESNYAKLVAKSSNLDINIIEPKTEDFINNIDEVIKTQEEPFGGPSILMQYFVMQEAKRINCKVMLDGQGGDETLLGYERYYPAYLMSLNFFDGIKNFFKSSKNSKLSIKQLTLYFFYFTNYRIRLHRLKQKNRFVKNKYLKKINKQVVKQNANNYLNIKDLQKSEILLTQLPHLLKYEDKNSMKHSVETRLPFLDYKLLETSLSTNNNFKINNGWTKYILRKTIDKILPKEIVWRKNKIGFEAPTDDWLKSISKEMQKSINKSEILKKIIDFNNYNYEKLDNKSKWKLFNIAKWEELFNVKINN